MVKRICVLFCDGSMNIHSAAKGEGHALAEAREEVRIWNKGETDPRRMAQVGEIEIDFKQFRERC